MDIKTYLLVPDKDRPDNFELEPEFYFIHIDEIERIKELVVEFDLTYMEGAIVFNFGDNKIFDYDLWFLISPFWSYFIDALLEMIINEKSIFYLPEMDVEVILNILNEELILFQIDKGSLGKFTLPKNEFIETVIKEGEHYFMRMYEVFSWELYKTPLEKIKMIRALM